ncbi:MAG: M48 family metalloprotease [archaeon]
MEVNNKTDTFELIYSFFMLVFGISVILCFIVVVAYMVILFNLIFLLFCWPILAGIWMGIFKNSEKRYEIELNSSDAKKLCMIINKVTTKTGLPKPYKIILSEGSGVAVTGLFRRKIIIGLATLQLLNENDLLAIIAHEYGHFAKKDTILGYFTYRIQLFFELQRDINEQNLAVSLSIIVYLPTWLFFAFLSDYYALISLWFSRRIEYRADKFAADFVGAKEFADALVKYSVISEIFENVIPKHILHFLQQNKQLVNIYDYMNPIYTEENVKKSFKEVLSSESSWWSTHPSISERLEALNAKSVDVNISTNQEDFIDDQKKYEEKASEVLSQKMAFWAHLASAQQYVESEDIEPEDEEDNQVNQQSAYFCTKCGNQVSEDDIHCKKCKQLLAVDGACVRREF